MENYTPSPDPISITLRVTKALETLGVAYFIGGSLASSFHGMVRTTQDADIIALLQLDHARLLTEALEQDFFIDEVMLADAIKRRSSFNILHKESMFKVDVFIPPQRAFTQQQFLNSKVVLLSIEPKMEAIIASPEDTILAKLEWYQQGGEVSDRQWRDILGLIAVQGELLDLGYLKQTAAQLGLTALLERAFDS
ncbi:MAG: hypothetical protein KIS88_02195 [Anaerolineales bacterium]|nr:hypothetical protein [Anaerolineales bacterium]